MIFRAAHEHVGDLPGGFVEADHAAVPATGIDDIGIQRVGSHVAKFETAGGKPVAIGDEAVVAAIRNRDRAAILLRRVGNVGKLVVGDDVIKLAGGLIEPGAPGESGVDADGGALVDTEKHAAGILGIDPEDVVIVAAGRAFVGGESDAAIQRTVHGGLHDVDGVGILRIDVHAANVEISVDARVFGDLAPGGAAVVSAEKAGLHDGKNTLALGTRRDGETNAVARVGGHAGIGDRFPGGTFVDGFVNPGILFGLFGRTLPKIKRLPHSGVENFRVIGIGRHIRNAGEFVAVKSFLPGFPAVGGFVYAAIFAGTERAENRMAEHAH